MTVCFPLIVSIDKITSTENNNMNYSKISYSRIKKIAKSKNWTLLKTETNPNFVIQSTISEI